MKTATASLSAVTRWARARPRAVDAAFAAAVGSLSVIGYLTIEATATLI